MSALPGLLSAALLGCSGPGSAPGDDTGCSPVAWSLDLDGDGWAGSETLLACTAPDQAVDQVGDCDDADPAVHPGAQDVCDGVDNDCDGLADPEGEAWYMDDDGDGFGDPDAPVWDCEQPGGAVADATDCDDSDAGSHPGAVEVWYDGIDQDCAGGSDWDADSDGAETTGHGGLDCDDQDPLTGPHMTEVCYDGIDNDCDGDEHACALGAELVFDKAAAALLEGDEPYEYLGTNVALIEGVTAGGAALAVATIDYYDTMGGDRVELYEWVEGELDLVARVSTREAYQGLGDVIHPPADYDGDGVDDLVLVATQAVSFEWGGPGEVHVFSGPVDGALTVTDADLHILGDESVQYSWAGYGMAGLLVGWGAATVAVSSPSWDNTDWHQQAGQVYLVELHSSFVDLGVVEDRIQCSHEECSLGEYLLSTDLDGDGVADLVASIQRVEAEAGTPSQLVTFLGPVEGVVSAWDHDGGLVTDQYDRIGMDMLNLGDQDGDGADDLLIPAPARSTTAEHDGIIWLYAASDLAETSDAGELARGAVSGAQDDDKVGVQLSAGDIDGDGTLDVVSANNFVHAGGVDYSGRIWAWFGPLAGTRTSAEADMIVDGSDDHVELGWALSAAADLNGDGCDDIAATEVKWPDETVGYGRAGVILGGCE